jgi:Zn-dependent protease with chaperone function
MILPYTLRLLCLCFASFFLVHAALGLLAWIATPSATRIGESMRPRIGARFLLMLRLLPATLAWFAVLAFCVPSYLWLETNEATERVGLACCAMALLGAVVCASSLIRSVRALWLSARHSMQYGREGRQSYSSLSLPVTVMNSNAPVLALAGILRPRVVVSRGVLQTFSHLELEAALAHEQAHHNAADNWKRLALCLAPEIFPFSQAFTRLNHSWSKLIEWAADDDATDGDARRSVSLAAALVHMARLGGGSATSPLASTFLKNDEQLPARVNRLLGLTPAHEPSSHRTRVALGTVAALAVSVAVAAMIRPETLLSVHRLLEQLLR